MSLVRHHDDPSLLKSWKGARSLILLSALLIVSWPGHAKFFSNSDTGGRGPAALKRQTGVRAAGLGGAFVSVADDASAVDWNPAGLQQLTRSEVLFMHEDGFADQSHEFAAYARPFWWSGNRRTWAGRVSYLSIDSFDTVVDGRDTGQTRPWEAVAGLSYAETMDSVSVGITGKVVHQTGTGQSGQAYALDGGLLGTVGRISWGTSVSNIGTRLKLGSEKMGLPFLWRNGVSYTHPLVPKNGVLLFALEFDVPIDAKPSSAFGMEYAGKISREWGVALRGGYRTGQTAPGDGLFVIGAGLEKGNFRLNYAFEPNTALGAVQRFDVGVWFGGPLPEEVRLNELLHQTRTDLEMGRWVQGKENVEKIKRLSPENPEARVLSNAILIRFAESLDPEMLSEEGDRAFSAGQFEKSAEFYRKLVLIQPDQPSAQEKLKRAESAIRQERMEQAQAVVEKGRRREVQEQRVWAQEAEGRSDWETALGRWRKVLALDRKNAEALAGVERSRLTLYELAQKAEASGNDGKAISFYTASQEGRTSYKDSAARLVELDQKMIQKRTAEGREKYLEGTRAFAAGDWARARGLFEEAIEISPKDQTIQRALDRVKEELARQGDKR